MGKVGGSGSLAIVDEPVFYLSPSAPAVSVLVCLAEAVPGLIYLWLRLRFSACSHVDYMALLFQKTLLVADLNFLLTQTHPTLCVCVAASHFFFCCFVLQGVLPPPISRIAAFCSQSHDTTVHLSQPSAVSSYDMPGSGMPRPGCRLELVRRGNR